MVSHSSFYNGSRSSVDQYRDMRLDVDNMSYEVDSKLSILFIHTHTNILFILFYCFIIN